VGSLDRGFADRGRVGTGVVFRSTSRLDKVFEVGILLKGLDGLLEVTGGILLFFIGLGADESACG
jgi:hypothetical protein